MFNADGEKFCKAEQQFLLGKEKIDSNISVDELKNYPINYEYTSDINNICIEIESIIKSMDFFQSNINSTKNRLIQLDSNFAKDYTEYSSKFTFKTLDMLNFNNRFFETPQTIEYVQPTKYEYLEIKLGEISNYFIENVATYWGNEDKGFENPRGYYQIPNFSRPVGDDCSEFATLFMSVVGNRELPETNTYGMIEQNGYWASLAKESGWNYYTTDEVSKNGGLQYGDVLICDTEYKPGNSQSGRHAEIYIDENHTFGWGSVKTSFPSNNVVSETVVNGETHYQDFYEDEGQQKYHDYVVVYRYEGEVPEDILINKK